MEQEQMTIEKVIRMVVQDLEAISIPMSMIETVGMPLGRSIRNLKVCISAIEQGKQQETEEVKEDERENDPE